MSLSLIDRNKEEFASQPLQEKSVLAAVARACLFTYLATSIFYLFPSGSPQIADMIMALGIGFCLLFLISGKGTRLDTLAFIAMVFGAFTGLVNTIHYVFLQDKMFFLSSLYYIYNGLILVTMVYLFKQNYRATYNVVYWGLAISIILEVIYFTVNPEFRGPRAIGSFNNPNQLAYWAFFCAIAIISLKFNEKLNLFDLFLMICVGYLQTVALSKAGIIFFAFVIGILILSRAIKNSYKMVAMMASVVMLIFALFQVQTLLSTVTQIEGIERSVARVADVGGETDDNLDARGYGRIWENPEYILLGAGEGAFWRYDTYGRNMELHSGIGTILFSYGLMGTFLFFYILYYVSKRSNWYISFLFIVVILYGIPHQNIRFSHFWVFLATAYVITLPQESSMRFRRKRQSGIFPSRSNNNRQIAMG